MTQLWTIAEVHRASPAEPAMEAAEPIGRSTTGTQRDKRVQVGRPFIAAVAPILDAPGTVHPYAAGTWARVPQTN